MKETRWKQIFKSQYFIILILCYLFVLEWISFNYFHYIDGSYLYNLTSRCPCLLGIGWIVLLSIIMIGIASNAYNFSTQIVKRFLNNALGLRLLSVVFILSFLVHISWLSDTSYEFFVNHTGSWLNIIITLLGMIVLFIIFPLKSNPEKLNEEKEKEKKTLLITGLTTPINTRALDLLFKPLLDNSGYKNIKDIVIFLSDGLLKDIPENSSIIQLKDIANNYKDARGKLNEVIPKIALSKGTDIELKNALKGLPDEDFLHKSYMDALKRVDFSKLKNTITDILKAYIKIKYPLYKDKVVNIHLSDNFHDYNKFEACYSPLGNLIKQYEKELDSHTSSTLIHISPGTALISSIMAIYAIKANRTLIYTSQENNSVVALDLNIWTTEEVLNELWKELDE